MNTFLVGIETDQVTGSRDTIVFYEDVLRVGMKVERRGFDEGPIRIVGIDKTKMIVALRHDGYTAYTGRASGSVYSQAAVSVHRYEIRNDYQSSGDARKIEGVHLVKCLMKVPITR